MYMLYGTRLLFGAALFAALLLAMAGAQETPRFEAEQTELPIGENVRIELKLIGPNPPQPEDITVEAARLDMGPDGMEDMAAPLKRAQSKALGVVAYQTELTMTGRWAFKITARVRGRAQPVQSTVLFTAVERNSDIDPAKADGKRQIIYYRNPMGLPDVSPVPRKDSMGMDYIPVYADEANGPSGTIRISPEKIQRAGVQTKPATRGSVSRTIRSPGTITADETKLGVVTARFSGFVEEIFVPAVGETVRRGQKLMKVWIESPDILQKQADLTAQVTSGSRSNIYEGAERNLRFFGFSDDAIAEIKKAGRPLRSLTFTAPTDGTVLEKPAVVGMRFSSGDMLFRTADLSTLWVIAQIAESDLSSIREGGEALVVVNAFPGEKHRGKIVRIYPELNPATRTVPVRIELTNDGGHLRPGLYADVSFEFATATSTIVIPDAAVMDTGTRRIVFVAKGNGSFEPRDVHLGARGDGVVEVRTGIDEGEDVVVRGNFLIDAESNLKSALAGFAPAESAK